MDTLNYCLHNVGLRLRDADATGVKELLEKITTNRATFANQVKFEERELMQRKEQGEEGDEINSLHDLVAQLKRHLRKVDFLMMEVEDIKNNRGKVTLAIKNLAPMETWLQRGAGDSRLASDLNKAPAMDFELDVLEQASRRKDGVINNWWSAEQADGAAESADVMLLQGPKDAKQENELQALSKALSMSTDVRKAILQALMNSEDYLHAFQLLNKLPLKKQ